MAARAERDGGWGTGLGLGGLAAAAAGVLGYHPYSEDGGIYLAEIKKALDGRLYPWGGEFVSGHLGRSGFVDLVVWVVRGGGVRLEVVVLALHLLCVWGVVVGIWRIGRLAYAEAPARWGAVGMVALCLTVPVAGTSLLLMDPYLTARAASLALTMLGVAGVAEFGVRRGWRPLVWGVAALGGAVWVHPLMGGYGVGFAAVLVCMLDGRRWVRLGGVGMFLAAGVAAGFVAQRVAGRETAEYGRVAATRYYWFLAEWQWYEWMGWVAPLAILAWVGWRGRGGGVERGLARAAVWVGVAAIVVEAVFVRETARVHAVARMQPLRCFQMVYVVMLIVLGARLGRGMLRRVAWRWVAAAGVLGGGMFAVQRVTYPASEHLEWPGRVPENRWEQAFLWVKANTPVDALFALDADYVHRPGEDAQGFRAVAERSALPDYSKDGGQAAIRPELTEAWAAGQAAQAGLTMDTDEERVRRLRPFGVSWIVVGREAVTGFRCPYANEQVKVCMVPRESDSAGGVVLR